jgi:hypothetical protein
MQNRIFLLFASAMVILTSCRKDPVNALSEAERRIYVTHKDPSANFAAYKTFTLADQVVVVQNGSSSSQLTSADQALIQAFGSALQQRGFTPVSRTATPSPDLGVQVSRITQTSTGVVTIGDYWDYWDPYWGSFYGGGWGWGAPGWGVATYQVSEAMLAIDIVDLKNRSTNNNVRVLWNGLVRGPGLNSSANVADIVQNLLNQSPYLQTN